MNKDKFASELSKLIKKHTPDDITQAFDMMFCLSGAMLALAHGVDSACDSPYTENQEDWSKPRAKFLAGVIYLLAASTPEADSGGMSFTGAMDGILPLIVEKCLWKGLKDGEMTDVAEAGSACLGLWLKQAVGLFLTIMYAPTRPDMNTEQLEAKGQDILNKLVATFTKETEAHSGN